MLIRIESRDIGTIQIATPDNASMGKDIAAIRQAIGIFSLRYVGRDRRDFLDILANELRSIQEPDDEPTDAI